MLRPRPQTLDGLMRRPRGCRAGAKWRERKYDSSSSSLHHDGVMGGKNERRAVSPLRLESVAQVEIQHYVPKYDLS